MAAPTFIPAAARPLRLATHSALPAERPSPGLAPPNLPKPSVAGKRVRANGLATGIGAGFTGVGNDDYYYGHQPHLHTPKFSRDFGRDAQHSAWSSPVFAVPPAVAGKRVLASGLATGSGTGLTGVGNDEDHYGHQGHMTPNFRALDDLITPVVGQTTQVSTEKHRYNEEMKQAMLNPFEYHPERGIYFHEVHPNLLVGSQPTSARDIARLHEQHGVSVIYNMQQDRDMVAWGVDKNELAAECHKREMQYVRQPARDFDPNSLRKMLPFGAAVLADYLECDHRVYVHCTAGLGRSPAMAIAYLYWFADMQLDEAYKYLVAQRPCGPKRDAVRGATFDLLHGGDADHFQYLNRNDYATMTEQERHLLQYHLWQRVLEAEDEESYGAAYLKGSI